MTTVDLRAYCAALLTNLATAPFVESTTRRELLSDALALVDGGKRLAEEIEGLAYVLHLSNSSGGADLAVGEAIDGAATLLADAIRAASRPRPHAVGRAAA